MKESRQNSFLVMRKLLTAPPYSLVPPTFCRRVGVMSLSRTSFFSFLNCTHSPSFPPLSLSCPPPISPNMAVGGADKQISLPQSDVSLLLEPVEDFKIKLLPPLITTADGLGG